MCPIQTTILIKFLPFTIFFWLCIPILFLYFGFMHSYQNSYLLQSFFWLCIPILFLYFGFMHSYFIPVFWIHAFQRCPRSAITGVWQTTVFFGLKEILDEKINKSHLILKFLYFFFKIPSGALQALHFCIHSGPLVYKYFKSCFYLVRRKKNKNKCRLNVGTATEDVGSLTRGSITHTLVKMTESRGHPVRQLHHEWESKLRWSTAPSPFISTQFHVAEVRNGGLLSAFRKRKYSVCVICPPLTWSKMHL
jgi:hypothetical protein